VEHAELNLITTDPVWLNEPVSYIETEFRPLVESQPGNLGMSLHTNSHLGVAVLETFWASDDAMRAGERIFAPSLDEAVRRGGGTLTVEHYAVPVFEQEGPVPADSGVRLTRMDVPPSGVDDAVEVFGDTAVPMLAETGGCRSIMYLVDYRSGRTISQSVWKDTEAMAASRSAAAAARVGVAEAAGGVVRTVEEYALTFSSARKD
jgi:quinol monooxygenase YgiN/heme-degrading monooxygenase HmoA